MTNYQFPMSNQTQNPNLMLPATHIAIFKGKQIRKTLFQNEWWFVVEDIILVLIDSNDPKQYIQKIKQRDLELAKGWVQIVHTLEINTEGGKQQMNCANTEGIFRIIQSIPSPKAEPFKRWLAKIIMGFQSLSLSFQERARERCRGL